VDKQPIFSTKHWLVVSNLFWNCPFHIWDVIRNHWLHHFSRCLLHHQYNFMGSLAHVWSVCSRHNLAPWLSWEAGDSQWSLGPSWSSGGKASHF
jgi:hypothetical protein